ncbi:unnamed protein product [Rotaria socialis]|uniref:IF rod domain-containing protein n=1 Tax=Rotaria socialis TaxID=392032 RepID=A0A817VN92_9BILA|nr:unnamed protein product [Rotaria socialis]CAF3336238.1 unnamed protein product [Rotaria socialis]CAF3343611.1 unnamed protein product [Rotaria socialis]CAF3554327.1 unnamed protein product [Rotaria socialis]CAF4198204.1 unnamed protein product [Rotaria socialis]
MAEESTIDQTSIITTDESSGIAPSNNFLGLLPPPYSMSSLKTTLALLQTSSLSSTSSSLSSSSYTNNTAQQTSTQNNNNYNPYSSYRANSATYTDSNPIGNSIYPMSSTTYRSSSFSIPKAPIFSQTREKEKLELSTLNDKFADYVEKVRYLEAQNKKVQMETGILNEKQQVGCQQIKTMFEKEVVQLKETIEALFKDKNSMNSSAKDAQNGILPLKQRLNQTFKECDSSKYETEKVERQLSSIEGDILMYKRRLAHQDDEHTQWKQLITQIQRLLLQAKNETHNETIARTSTEQATKQLRLDISQLREQQQQKLKDVKQTTLLNPSLTNDRSHIFKSELSSAIKKIREDNEKQNELQRNTFYEQFTQAYEDIARQYPDLGHLFLNEREQERVKQEEDRVRQDIQRVKTDINLLKQKNGELRLRTRELQINLEMSLEENSRFEQIQHNEIEQLKLKQEKISKDYDDVISKQTSLEKEIDTYRNLLEGTMKTVVDTITDDYNSATTNQTKLNHPHQQQQQQQQLNSLPNNRPTRSTSVDRSPSSPYLSTLRNHNNHTNSYSRFMTYKYNNGTDTESIDSSPAIDIPTTIENGLITSKSVGDLSVKNGIHPLEINEVTNDSSSPNSRPTTILQTRRS